jgi:hypothetical protein
MYSVWQEAPQYISRLLPMREAHTSCRILQTLLCSDGLIRRNMSPSDPPHVLTYKCDGF